MVRKASKGGTELVRTEVPQGHVSTGGWESELAATLKLLGGEVSLSV